jgi:hypothetical protein
MTCIIMRKVFGACQFFFWEFCENSRATVRVLIVRCCSISFWMPETVFRSKFAARLASGEQKPVERQGFSSAEPLYHVLLPQVVNLSGVIAQLGEP